MTSVFEHAWLGGLFSDEEAMALWSPQVQLGHFKAFEVALAHALETVHRVPEGVGAAAAYAINEAQLDVVGLNHHTGIDGLPVPEFVRQLRTAAGEAAEAVHTGATSQDVLDTALALTLKALTGLFLVRLKSIHSALERLEADHGARDLMARTRMQAALPITAADRIAAWRRPIARHSEHLKDLRFRVQRLQLGGAVGTAHIFGEKADEIAWHMAQELGLFHGTIWHTDRSALIEYAGRLSAITGSLGKIGQDIALMAQQGVDEIVITGGGGSSAMLHKSNPVLAELLVTLARFNATQVSGMHQALVHEQERSGAAWMLEWMILPQMTAATGRALSACSALLNQIDNIGQPNRTE